LPKKSIKLTNNCLQNEFICIDLIGLIYSTNNYGYYNLLKISFQKEEVNMNPKMTVPEAAELLNITGQAILKKIKQKSLEHKKSQNRVFFGHTTAKEVFKFQFSPKIIAIQVVKGGTGKTALTQSIAVRASLYGAKVLCVDLDQQGNLTQSFGIDADAHNSIVMLNVVKGEAELTKGIIPINEGLHLFPSRINNASLEDYLMTESLPIDRVYKEYLDPLKSSYDLIIIDCPPALGRSVAASALSSDFVISPIIPEQSSLTGLDITFNALKVASKKYKRKINVKIVLNKFDVRTSLSHKILTYLIEHQEYRNCLFRTYIRQNQEFPNTFYKHTSIFDSVKPSTAKEDIDLLTREILEIIPAKEKEKDEKSFFPLESYGGN